MSFETGEWSVWDLENRNRVMSVALPKSWRGGEELVKETLMKSFKSLIHDSFKGR